MKKVMMFIFLLLILEGWWSEAEGCLEQEKSALLQLKPFFDYHNSLVEWVEGDENSDCCRWEGVVCSNTTNRVIELHLQAIKYRESTDSWNLNASLFTPFQQLEYLDLEGNNIAGCFDNEGLEKLSELSNLKHLDLWGNLFNNSILSLLGSLSSLTALNLGHNRLKGSINLKEFDSLSNLERLSMTDNEIENLVVPKGGLSSLRKLYLEGNKFKGSIDLKEFDSLSNLEELGMSNNEIENLIVPKDYKGLRKLNTLYLNRVGIRDGSKLLRSMRSFPSLKALDLSNNNFTETVTTTQSICELVNLQELYIENSDLRGSLPWCLANMTSLRVLDVSFNQLTGNISSSSPFMYLTSVEDLILSNNHFRIPISLEPFFNLSKLKNFDGANNQMLTELESHSLIPKFQLTFISLSGQIDGGTFPKFLYHQHDLECVYLSHVNLSGEFPNWLLENNTKLETLLLPNNSLSGSLYMPFHSHESLLYLDVSNNDFQGQIPVEIKELLPRLNLFNISMNAFNSSIPSSFGGMKSLTHLDLSHNQLTGEIPEHLVTGCHSLEGLYLNDNHLSGEIPQWLGNLSSLQRIIMFNNHLEGSIPMDICKLNSLEILDISNNSISGSLPSCFNPPFIQQVHLSKNMLNGRLKEGTFFNCSSLVTLDLSYNHLNGSIPDWIGGLSQLGHLILAHNNLEGEIPIQLCQLQQLYLIDLSHNNLYGHIPHCLDNTTIHASYNDTPFEGFIATERYWSIEDKAIHETFQFTTKNRAYTYQGRLVNYMSGVDLSCNKLIGEIPPQIGYLTMIHALNLSHNNLTGSIPSTFSNLKQVESLDLSYNKLNGKIPLQLVELNFLASFSVAHNNLSGMIPAWTAQFATFNVSSYEENPSLCGRPLPKSCNDNGPPVTPSTNNGEGDNLVDMDSFYITFTTSYIIVILGIGAVLYVNPYWRQRWFYFVETWMNSCYYFVEDNLIPTRFCR